MSRRDRRPPFDAAQPAGAEVDDLLRAYLEEDDAYTPATSPSGQTRARLRHHVDATENAPDPIRRVMFAGVGMLVEASGNTVSVAVEGIPLSLEGSREEAYALADLLLFMATARRG